jgi:hypothetical protein
MKFCLTSIAAVALLALMPWSAQAAEPDISVTCGSAGTTSISTGNDLRNVRAIHITVDPDNKCHVDVSFDLKEQVQKPRTTRVRQHRRRFDTARITFAPRCFTFGGRRYCE